MGKGGGRGGVSALLPALRTVAFCATGRRYKLVSLRIIALRAEAQSKVRDLDV